MLKLRVITALVLVTALGSVLFLLPPIAAILAISAISAIAAWEWSGLLLSAVAGRWLFPLWILLLCFLVRGHAEFLFPLWIIAAGFWLLLIPAWFAGRWRVRSDLPGYLTGTVVIVPAWAAMVQLYLRGPWQLLAVMALVWIADIAAYFVGRAVGRHKLAPTISPGKTWEGAFGAVVAGLVYGQLLNHYEILGFSLDWYVVIGIMVALVAVSIVGDLFESLIKRQANVKDSSNLLPGHGGVLDRIDSLTSTLPLAALGLYLMQI
jgi:phosphatidate cytidylyltransferase